MSSSKSPISSVPYPGTEPAVSLDLAKQRITEHQAFRTSLSNTFENETSTKTLVTQHEQPQQQQQQHQNDCDPLYLALSDIVRSSEDFPYTKSFSMPEAFSYPTKNFYQFLDEDQGSVQDTFLFNPRGCISQSFSSPYLSPEISDLASQGLARNNSLRGIHVCMFSCLHV